MSRDTYMPTIGIECHVQLRTKTKLFSGADNDARDAEPNTTVSPLCFGLPGVLPVLNREAIILSIRAGLALKSTIASVSRFERKHYFYPDLPLGYQITQLAEPIIGPGVVRSTLPDGSTKDVRIHHAHLEADAGKLTHPAGADYSLVDYNRAGTPLIEIVSEADMHSPAEAKAYAEELYRLMTYAEVTFGDLYHGNMRFDVNVSVAKQGQPLGTRTETKNLNSFKSVERAAEFEINRQIKLLEKGEEIVQETRGWNDDRQETFSQRSKENAHDYRYFPDADLPPVRVTDSQVSEIRATMPPMPDDYRLAWQALNVDHSVINALLATRHYAEVIRAIQETASDEDAKRVAHWFASALGHRDDDEAIGLVGNLDPARFVELSAMVTNGKLSSTSAKEVFVELLTSDDSPEAIAKQKNLIQISDDSVIAAIVDEVMSDPASQKVCDDIRAGNDKAIGFLVGQVMKKSKGQANPALAQRLIRERL